MFVKTASTAHSTFHTEKAEGNPAIFHAEGPAGFEKAKHAVERDLTHVMRAYAARSEKVTYSVHYSDVNGLSRLENYILGLEIAKYFGMCISRWRHEVFTNLTRISEHTLFSVNINSAATRQARSRIFDQHLSSSSIYPSASEAT